jgi:hypothetical protein
LLEVAKRQQAGDARAGTKGLERKRAAVLARMLRQCTAVTKKVLDKKRGVVLGSLKPHG